MGYEHRPVAMDSVGNGPVAAPRHSRELARQLVRRLGIQGATRTCQENHWQGVLDIIHAMNQKS
jgi:hypothetical protein